MRVVVATAITIALAACAPTPGGRMTVAFDKPMLPEDVGQMFVRCHIHDDPIEGPSFSLWQVEPDLSSKEIACLKRQPHVKGVLGAM